MRNTLWKTGLGLCALGFSACANDPVVVASNKQALQVDKVDILMVVDDSGSMADLQMELPGLLDKLVAGSTKAGQERPALNDVHLAVVSTDMGIGQQTQQIGQCSALGDDGVFIPLSSDDLARCNASMPRYLAYQQETAVVTTVEAVSCIPDLGTQGCGFEQPLEASLKALWPSQDNSITFSTGTGHGDAQNSGFLRDNSLLIVMVLTDEDDCSAQDDSLFDVTNSNFTSGDINLRCPLQTSYLHAVQRYADGLKRVRSGDQPMLFVVLGGIPEDLVSSEAQAAVDWNDAAEVAAYYDGILDDARMQNVVDPTTASPQRQLTPVCRTTRGRAMPARRLVQVAKSFGKAGVLGSVCANDFGDSMAAIIRAAADNL